MPFITDPELDRLMGRNAPRGGAFAALLCLAQLAPDAPAPLEVLIQALNAWWEEQQDDLMSMLQGLEERERVITTSSRTGITITVLPALLPEVERQLGVIPDEERAALLAGVRADVDTALTELVFDVGDVAPAHKEVWCRMFIPHLLHRVTDNPRLLPTLANVVAHYEPARFDSVAQLIPAFLDTLPTGDPAIASEDEHSRQVLIAMHAEMLLQAACLAVEGVSDARLRRSFHVTASAVVSSIERHQLEWSLNGLLRYASLRETPLEEAQCLLRTLFERHGGTQVSGAHVVLAHRVVATWLRRLRRDAPNDPMLQQLLPFAAEVTFEAIAPGDHDPELALGVAECMLVQAAQAIDAGAAERASALLAATIKRIAEGADVGAFDDNNESADRLVAEIACMQAQVLAQHGDTLEARQRYSLAIASLRRDHGRQHQLVRQLESARRKLTGSRISKDRPA